MLLKSYCSGLREKRSHSRNFVRIFRTHLCQSFRLRIALREDVVTTVRVIAENSDANEALLVECLRSIGYETLQAELLVAFVPFGTGSSHNLAIAGCRPNQAF